MYMRNPKDEYIIWIQMEHHKNLTPVNPIIIFQSPPSKKELIAQSGRTHHPETPILTAKKFRDTHHLQINTDLSSTAKRNFSDVMEIEHNSEDSAEDFSSLLKTKSPEKKVTPVIDLATNKTRIEKVSDCLVKCVGIVCPLRFRLVDFNEALKVYRYDKKRAAVFGETSEKVEKSNDYALKTLADIFSGYRSQEKNQFYVMYNRSCMYFTRKGPQKKPILLIYAENEYIKRYLLESNINFSVYDESVNEETIIISDMNIARYWNKFINQVVSKDLALEIISNFKYFGCYESLPRIAFNGPENNKKYDYLRKEEKQSKLQKCLELEPKPSLFNAKLEGYLMKHNLEALNSALEHKGTKFQLSFEPVKQTEKFKEMMEKKQ